MLNSDAGLQSLATAWAAARALPSPRICPLCLAHSGTPRHVVMTCSAMQAVQEHVRDVVEAELRLDGAGPRLMEAAAAFWTSANGSAVQAGVVPPLFAARWPILSAWRWLVPIPAREEQLGENIHHGAEESPANAPPTWHTGA